jgi:hypothetical protein
MRHQSTSVKIDSCNICRVGNDTCANNGKYVCYQCQIFSGNPNVPVRFTPALKSLPTVDSVDQKKIIIQLPPLQEEVKVAPISEDDLDKSNFVKHLSIAFSHFHSENFRIHRHFICKHIGDFCVFCGIPIVGSTICESCKIMFEDNQRNQLIYFSNGKR